MGFWHTGYMEFHEPVGLDGSYPPDTTIYRCHICDKTFNKSQELQAHRFEAHPFERPLLFIRGLEVGSTPIRITRTLKPQEVVASRFDRARINGTLTVAGTVLTMRRGHGRQRGCRVVTVAACCAYRTGETNTSSKSVRSIFIPFFPYCCVELTGVSFSVELSSL
jgi:hypothetical protein